MRLKQMVTIGLYRLIKLKKKYFTFAKACIYVFLTDLTINPI